MDGFSNLLHDTSLADISFSVEGGRHIITAHRAVLAGRCRYFLVMFTGGFREAKAQLIPLHHIRADVFQQLLQYLYTEEVQHIQYPVELYAVSDEFQVEPLKELALRAIEDAEIGDGKNSKVWAEARAWLSEAQISIIQEIASQRIVLKWDPQKKGMYMNVSQDQLEVESSKSDDWKENIRTTRGFQKGRHSWDIEVLTKCNAVWVGLATEDADMDCWLGKQSNGWVMGAASLCHATSKNNGPYEVKYGRSLKKGDVVRVYLDMDNKTCSFELNGAHLGVAWNNLPKKQLYPAVSLSSPGRVKIGNYKLDAMETEE